MKHIIIATLFASAIIALDISTAEAFTRGFWGAVTFAYYPY
jgi:hypothetical protein